MKKKRCSILPKKLRELDLLVNNASLQPKNPGFQLIMEDIEQRLSFVKNLLSAEIASHPEKQHHLENMSQRVGELEAAYRDWGTGSVTTTSTLDHVDNVHDDNDDDRASKCSCLQDEENVSDDLESTLGQDKEGVCDDLMKAMPVTVFNNLLFEENVSDDVVSYNNGSMVEDGKEVRVDDVDLKKKGLGFGKLCGAVASGVVIGMVSMCLMMMESSEYDGYGGHGNFLTPT
ncbi:hypothetical protein M0R45_037838 [Rubus argutus]|uniref:DUF7610 domain-containing protein n=1 Tax=Rubus argutus TaxID=59490 RepID=A0AAW1W1F7_RUBAR